MLQFTITTLSPIIFIRLFNPLKKNIDSKTIHIFMVKTLEYPSQVSQFHSSTTVYYKLDT